MKTSISILEKLQREEFKKNYKELGLDKLTYESFVDSNFEWACDNCLESKKAILARQSLQETPWDPHLAYGDTKFNCYLCKTDFLFKKEEKKAWYESYKLPINSKPNNCLTCRREIRQQKFENKIVSETLKKPEHKLTEDELKTVIDIYITWGKMERIKYFQSVLDKRLKKSPT